MALYFHSPCAFVVRKKTNLPLRFLTHYHFCITFRPISILSSHLHLDLSSGSFLSGFPTESTLLYNLFYLMFTVLDDETLRHEWYQAFLRFFYSLPHTPQSPGPTNRELYHSRPD